MERTHGNTSTVCMSIERSFTCRRISMMPSKCTMKTMFAIECNATLILRHTFTRVSGDYNRERGTIHGAPGLPSPLSAYMYVSWMKIGRLCQKLL